MTGEINPQERSESCLFPRQGSLPCGRRDRGHRQDISAGASVDCLGQAYLEESPAEGLKPPLPGMDVLLRDA